MGTAISLYLAPPILDDLVGRPDGGEIRQGNHFSSVLLRGWMDHGMGSREAGLSL